MLPATAAVAAIVALILLLLVFNGQPGRGPSPAVVAPLTPSSALPTAPAGVLSSRPTAPATPNATPRAATQVRPQRPALVVLNNSRIYGLAAHAAAQFAAAGWPIATIGGFEGRLSDSAIFYSPGYLAAAQQLLDAFPRLDRILARWPGLPAVPLTVVVTRYYVYGRP
jgi:hypothetical protein